MILGPRHVPVWTKTNTRRPPAVVGVLSGGGRALGGGNGCWSVTAFARSLLREVFYGMQWDGPPASYSRRNSVIKSPLMLLVQGWRRTQHCYVALHPLPFHIGLGRCFFLHFHHPRA